MMVDSLFFKSSRKKARGKGQAERFRSGSANIVDSSIPRAYCGIFVPELTKEDILKTKRVYLIYRD